MRKPRKDRFGIFRIGGDYVAAAPALSQSTPFILLWPEEARSMAQWLISVADYLDSKEKSKEREGR